MKDIIFLAFEKLVFKNGLSSVSNEDIASIANIEASTILQYFPKDHDLIAGYIDWCNKKFVTWSNNVEKIMPCPEARLGAFLDLHKKAMMRGELFLITGFLEAQFKNYGKRATNELTTSFYLRKKWMKQVLIDGLYEGKFKFAPDVEIQALMVLSTLQGVCQIARANEQGYFIAATAQIKNGIINQPVGKLVY